MAGAALKGLAVLHHGLDGVGVEGSCKTLGGALHTLYYGHSHPFLCKFGIDVQHLLCFLLCLLLCGVGCVALLPKKL